MIERITGLKVSQMFGGARPSRGAGDLVARASMVGINPIEYTTKAGMASLKEGRKKTGFFGDAMLHLSPLKEAIISIENEKAVSELSRKANRK